MVMPNTWASGDCSSTIMAIWFDPPGPEPSWSMRTRRFSASAREKDQQEQGKQEGLSDSEDAAFGPNIYQARQGRLGSKVQPGTRYCIAARSSRSPRPSLR